MGSQGGEETRILHVSDTHLGYAPYGSTMREADFTDAFTQAVEIACERDVDAVIHTGDMTHDARPEGGLPESAWRALRRLADEEVPFYFVLGNHDITADGSPQRWVEQLVGSGLGTRLGSQKTTIGRAAVYGVDYRPAAWWENPTLEFEPPHDGQVPLLCLHQSVAPVAPGHGGIELPEVLRVASVSFPAVLAGHSHYTQAAVVDGTQVFYAGSPERTTRAYNDERTVVTELAVGDTIERTTHDLDTRAFGTYTVVPDDDRSLDAVFGDAVAGEVVTLFYPGGRADGAHVEAVAEAAGAVDATAHATSVSVHRDPGLYESTPEDLSDLGAADDTVAGPHRTAATTGNEAKPEDDGGQRSMKPTNDERDGSERTGDGPTVLHAGALHIGAANLSIDRRADFQRSLSQVVEEAIDREVTAVVQSGTFFGTGSPPNYTIEQCRETLERLERAGIPFLHAGSERDRRMEEFDSLVEDGLITRVDSDPVLIGETAFYGLSPGDGTTYSMGVGSFESPPAAADYVIVSGSVSVSPPMPGGDATFDAAALRDALPIPVDALLLGGGESRATERGEPDILYPGPTERMLYQSAFDELPAYPCTVSTYELPGGSYEPIELDYRDVHTYEFDVTPGTSLQAITERLDADLADATVMVRLGGQCAADDFDAGELESWLEARAAIVKVYDKRVVAASAAETEEPDVEPAPDDADTEGTQILQGNADDGRSPSGEVAAPMQDDGRERAAAATDGQRAVASEPEPDSPPTEGAEVTTPRSSAEAARSSATSAELRDEFFPGAGSDIDPDAHLAGEQLYEAGFAEVRPTADGTCGYVFHASEFASATDQRRGVAHRDLDGGDWHCSHPADAGDRCPFHAPLSETDVDLEAYLLRRLDSGEPGSARFIGATFPELSLIYEEIAAGADSLLDFTHAEFEGDVRFADVGIEPEVRLDGVAVGGKLSVQNTEFQRKLRLRGARFEDGIYARWSRFGGVVAFRDAVFGDEIVFQNCDFDSASFSRGTYEDDLTLMKSRFRSEVYFYDVEVGGQVDCTRVSFDSELRFEGAFLEGGTEFEEASFADILIVEGAFAGDAFSLTDATANHRIQLESVVTPTLDCTELRAEGRVEILGGEIGELVTESGVFADDLRLVEVDAGSVDLRQTKLQRGCQLLEPRIEEGIDASGVIVGGSVELLHPLVSGAISLVNARIEGRLAVLGAVPELVAQGIRVDGNVTLKTDDDSAGPIVAPGGSFGDRVELTGSGEWVALELPNGTFDGSVTIEAATAGDVEASDAVFRDATVFSGDVGGSLRLVRARFTERLGVKETRVEESLSLVGARLDRGIAIDDATLDGLNASGATCTGSIEVYKSRIAGHLRLADATATGTVEISGGVVGGVDASEAVFEDTVRVRTDIDGALELAAARFDGHTRFDSIDVEGPVSLEELRCIRLGFDDVSFEAGIDASRATLERRARFTNCTVEGVATFAASEFGGGVTFEGTEFWTEGSFEGCRVAGRADFTGTRFATTPTFSNAVIEEAVFDELGGTDGDLLTVDCSGATIRGGRVAQPESGTRYDFTDAQLGPVSLDLDGGLLHRYRFYRTNFDGFQFSDHTELAAADWRIHEYGGGREASPEGLETTYRRAKNGASQVGDSDAEGHFFVQEMRHRQATYRQTGERWKALVNEVYRRSSGYGESPGTVIKSSGYAVLLFAGLFPVTKILALLASGHSLRATTSRLLSSQILEAPYNGPFGWVLLSVESFTTLVHGGTSVVHPWVRGIGAFEGFFGAFFIALFLFTLTKAIDR